MKFIMLEGSRPTGETINPWSLEAWAKRTGPQYFAGTLQGRIIALSGIVLFLLLLGRNSLSHFSYSDLPITLIVIAIAGWSLGKKTLGALVGAGLAVHLFESYFGYHDWQLALAGTLGIPLVAVATRLLAVDRARHRLLGEQQRELRQLNFLLETAEQLAASLNEEEILTIGVNSAARGVARTSGGRRSRASFNALQGDVISIAVESDESGTIGFEYPLTRNPAVLKAVSENRATYLRREEFAGALADLADKLDVKASIYAPVKVGDRVKGILVASHLDAPEVEDNELRLMEVLARLISLALGSAENLRYQQEHSRQIADVDTTKLNLLNLASHELRGPLTVARGYLSMLADERLREDQGKADGTEMIIISKLTEMEILLDQMLEASKLNTEQNKRNPRISDLRRVASEAVGFIRPLIVDDREITLHLPDQEVRATVDPDRITTIINNLITNALKFSPEGQKVDCRVASDGHYAQISIRDQGIGISPEDLPRLFTRFSRIVTDHNADINGAGLGLFLSREMAKEEGGDITVVSALGQGSEFTLTLPMATS